MITTNQILLGDCLDVLKTIPDTFIDAIVTDPPYGLGNREPTAADIQAYLSGSDLNHGGDFMGYNWSIPSVAVWKECYRVLKPGGHLLSFGGCYDEETEVLTKQGWLRFSVLTGNEEFASLDLQTHKVGWQRAKELVCQFHHGPMFHYKTNKIDLLVTPNHKMVVAMMGDKKKNFKLIRADQVRKAIRMTKTSKGRSDAVDPCSIILPETCQLVGHGHEKIIPAKAISLDAWLPFFGLYLAEGSTSFTKHKTLPVRGYNVAIAHSNINNLLEIQRLLAPWFNVRVYPKLGKLRINGKQLASYLRQFGKAWQKFIPEWIKQLPADRLKVLLDWYLRGDGCEQRCAYTTSVKLRDDLQEIAMYMGMSADWVVDKPRKKESKINGRIIHKVHSSYTIGFHRVQTQPEVYTSNSRKKSQPPVSIISAAEWKGKKVYCVELEKHHTLYVRRNGKAVWCGNTRTFDLISVGIRAAGFENRDTIASYFGTTVLAYIYGSGFPKSLNISKAIDKMLGAKREVIGRGFAGLTAGKIANFSGEKEFDLTVPATEDAKKWDGWGTALKPSWEPILVFRKPIEEKTIAAQVLATGTGGVNIDACRVEHSENLAVDREPHKMDTNNQGWGFKAVSRGNQGRWPANILLVHSEGCKIVGTKKVSAPVINRFTDGMKPFGEGVGHAFTSEQTGDADGMEEIPIYECEDGCPVKMLDEHSGQSKSPGGTSRFFGQLQPDAPFFYSGKASRGERNSGLVAKGFEVLDLVIMKESISEEEQEKLIAEWPSELTDPDMPIEKDRVPEKLREFFEPIKADYNYHPTLKPLALMTWLVKLVTPKGATVLDPFCGSGTTCIAAIDSDCQYIGIEKDPAFHDIATRRIKGLASELVEKAALRKESENFESIYDLPQDD